jgi:GTPase SAR1 family protein
MTNIKITVSGGAKTGKSTLLSAFKHALEEVYKEVSVIGTFDQKTEQEAEDYIKLIPNESITLEEITLPSHTGDIITDLQGLGFKLSYGKDYSEGGRGEGFEQLSLSINNCTNINVTNNIVSIEVVNQQNIGRTTKVGAYDFYKVINLVNAFKSFN